MDYVKELRLLVGHKPLILTGAVAIIMNDQNEVLLQLRTKGKWGLPGGLMELGESLEETAQRETKEETGLTVNELTFLGVFSGKDYYNKLENMDEYYAVTAVYFTNDVIGEIRKDHDESLDIQYFPLDQLPAELAPQYRSFIEPFKNELMKLNNK
ncbi:NUDIX hydrolase [Bacillus sp. 03113]|uniref:NUDIX hydrolase n=1 Tax=Bacillus sp. 03113 TaxID=2578211 RepID=UPI00114354D6|nr:NUDIX hydrolase [Bacillus sp. 03113]